MAQSKKNKLYNVHIIDHVTSEQVREGDGKQYSDRGETQEHHSIEGFEVVKKGGYRDLSVSFHPDKDKAYYLLYVIYDTGDSFGRDCGKIEFVRFYQGREVAEKNRTKIVDHYEKNKKSGDGSLKLETEGGTEYSIYAPWVGFFECLVSVEIELIRQVR